jgi:hypothetical protein
MENYTHSVSPGKTITLNKIKMLAIIIPTNGNTEDLIRYKFEEKKEKIKCIVHACLIAMPKISAHKGNK